MTNRWGWAFSLAAVLTAAAAAASPDRDTFDDDVSTAKLAVASNDCAAAMPLIRRAIASPRMTTSPDALAVWEMGAECAGNQKAWAEALRDAEAATAFPKATDWVWRIRITLNDFLDHPDKSVELIETLAHDRPDVLTALEERQIGQIDRKLRGRGASALRRRLFAALDSINYQPTKPFDSADGYWVDYAAMLADAGDMANATRVLGRVNTTYGLIVARLDKRFDPIIAASPDRFDPRRVAEAQLARDQAAMAANPDLLEGILSTSRDLRRLGRSQEALAMLDKAAARVAAMDPANPDFSDLADAGNWLPDERARNLNDLGRFEEGLAVRRTAAATNEGGGPNVSQTINLADDLLNMGRPQESLDVLAVFGVAGETRSASLYGVMEMMVNRACAYSDLGQAKPLQDTLAYISAHEKDNEGAVTNSLLCTGDLDGAAASFVRRLADPDERQGALLDLVDFTDARPMTPRQALIDKRWRAVRGRPDVQAAAAAVGRIESIPLRGEIF